MGRYTTRLFRLLQMPEDGLPIGTFRPADSPLLIRELATARLRALIAAGNISGLDSEARSEIQRRMFHTWEDFLLDSKQDRPGRNDTIGYGRSLSVDSQDAAGYLAHIAAKDPQFATFIFKDFDARIDWDAFDTSVYITSQTKSGKSYLSQLLAGIGA